MWESERSTNHGSVTNQPPKLIPRIGVDGCVAAKAKEMKSRILRSMMGQGREKRDENNLYMFMLVLAVGGGRKRPKIL